MWGVVSRQALIPKFDACVSDSNAAIGDGRAALASPTESMVPGIVWDCRNRSIVGNHSVSYWQKRTACVVEVDATARRQIRRAGVLGSSSADNRHLRGAICLRSIRIGEAAVRHD